MTPRPLVTILTYCDHPALAYGTLLVFKTLRTGFPTADIEIFDNGSHPDVRDEIMWAAADVGATFTGIRPKHWAEHLRWLILERRHGNQPLVLLDPDVVFWQSVEDWDFGEALVAGRRIQRATSGPIVSHSRLHPSLLWISDVERLRGAMPRNPESLISPRLESVEGEVHFWDTLSRLYEEMGSWCTAFQPKHLDCYDHLFFGSHLPMMDALAGDGFEVIRDAHKAAASGDLSSLRGIWREQEAYFTRETQHDYESIQVAFDAIAKSLPTRQLDSIRAAQTWQGMQFTDKQLTEGVQRLTRRMGYHKEENV
jgi:hypothetical protein